MTQMTKRKVLIVDDQQAIHDTFARVFEFQEEQNDTLLAFESEFLEEAASGAERGINASARPQFLLTHVHSGEEGVQAVRESMQKEDEERFSVAFVDMRMPGGIDGLETVDQLWSIDPDLQVVICTAFSDHTWDEVLERLGYNDRLLLLKKPFESDETRQLALALSEKWRMSRIQWQKVAELEQENVRRRDAEQQMRKMAHRDALTSLPNRPYLIEKLDSIVKNRKVGDRSHCAILFLDLDNFKVINDSLGHDAGDMLLNQVALRLQECVRQNREEANNDDETVRLGGDEFVVLLQNLEDKNVALDVARRIVTRVSEPFCLVDRMVNVGTSVGVAYIDDSVRDAHDTLRNADTAMYRAKNTGKGQVAVFDKTMHDAVVARHQLELQLRASLKKGLFELKYQPIVDLRKARIAGVEVLLRWKNSDGQYVPPATFIPVVEEIGLIQQLGEWMLEKMIREFTKMLDSLPENVDRNVYAGVNVSRRQLSNPFFPELINKIINRTGFDRSLLKLEMSEDGDPRHQKRSVDNMNLLTEHGIGIHVDDFGKGKSSLTCFKDYAIETVKVDRSFSSSITTDQRHRIIMQSIIHLAHQLDSKLVCEGIEDAQQLSLLRSWNCDLAQGYFFAPPLELEELRDLLIRPSKSEGIRSLVTSVPTVDMGSPGYSETTVS